MMSQVNVIFSVRELRKVISILEFYDAQKTQGEKVRTGTCLDIVRRCKLALREDCISKSHID